MSSTGTPQIETSEMEQLRSFVADAPVRVAVVASRWHTEVMDGLIAGAWTFLEAIGIEDPTLVRAPGSFELPVLAQQAAANHDAVIALGVVIRGGTPHFDYVCGAAAHGLGHAALSSGVPIGFGLLTCDDEQQALARAGLEGSQEDKGFEAAHAAVSAAVELARLTP